MAENQVQLEINQNAGFFQELPVRQIHFLGCWGGGGEVSIQEKTELGRSMKEIEVTVVNENKENIVTLDF